MSRTLQVGCIETPEELAACEEVWDELLARCPYRNLFLTHRWMAIWWKHFGAGRRLRVLTFRDGGRVVGLAPLMLERTRLRGLPVRQLGSPVNGCSLQSDLVVPERREEVFRAFVAHLEESARDWDVVFLDGIAARSGNLPLLRAALEGSSLALAPPTAWDCLVLPVAGDWEIFRQGLPRNLRKNLRVSEQRLQSLGEIACVRFDRPEQMDQAFDLLLKLEQRSWKGKEGQSLASSENGVAFYRDCAAHYARQGAFQVRAVLLNGEAIAGNFVVVHEGTVYGQKTWYDERYAEASPGRALFHYLVRDVWGSGVVEIFLDRTTPFYEQWTRETRTYHTLRLFNRRLYSAAIGWLRTRFARRAGSRAVTSAAAPVPSSPSP